MIRMRDLGNTVIVVEHDEETIRVADHVVDIGPGAGEHGGSVVYSGPYKGLLKAKDSVTGAYLSRRKSIPVPERPPADHRQEARRPRRPGAQPQGDRRRVPPRRLHLRHRCVGVGQVDARERHPAPLPDAEDLQVEDAPRPPQAGRRHRAARQGHRHRPVADRPHARSNPATYTGVFDHIRKLFAADPGGEGPRLPARSVQLQRVGWSVRGVCRRRDDQDRDALPAGRVRARARCARAPATTATPSTSRSRARTSPTSST